MKKLIALCLMTALVVMTLGPALSAAGTGPVTTGLIKGSGSGSAPIVKAKWEMLNLVSGAAGVGEAGDDDSTSLGAQFMPPGVWETNLEYTVCAIATDPDSTSDIVGVYAEIFYPEGVAYSEDPAHPDDLGDPDYEYDGVGACGAFIEQNTLIQLTKAEGYELFCNQVRNNNENLPTFYSTYDYDEICASDGELMEGTAFVYCDDKTLKWEDPAGDYRVVTYAQDKAGKVSPYVENYFDYLAFTGFEKDFDGVNYGEILYLSETKIIHGDKTFGSGDGKPTVRNIGNTRLNMWIAQDDMGLQQSSGVWNIEFDARVGTDEADWEIYQPYGFKGGPAPALLGDYTELEDILELSEEEKMDFSVHVKKWLEPDTYDGTMWLAAEMASFRTCPVL